MANMSDYLENKILDHTLGKASYTMPTTTYLALYTVTPSDSGGGTEVSGTAYARVALPTLMGTASGGSITNTSDINFAVAGSAWGTIVAVGIFDALTVGNLLWWGPLAASKTIATSDQFKIAASNLTINLN